MGIRGYRPDEMVEVDGILYRPDEVPEKARDLSVFRAIKGTGSAPPLRQTPATEDKDDEEPGEPEPDEYESMTNAQLRAELKSRDLSTSGSQAELRERLRAADAS